MSESEVARLRRQIELEFEAMQRGMNDFAVGMARHDFIRARMKHVSNYQDKLAEHIGDADASRVVCMLYVEIMGK
jgi:hypothetical protein